MKKQHHKQLKHLLLTCLIVLVQANLVRAQCDQNVPNFTRLGTYGSSVYFLSNSPAQPIVAESAALAMGGNLVDINSQGENDFIASMIDEMTYIGLNDANSEGNLSWTSNATVTFTNYDNCGFCNGNDSENDYALIHPWNGGWSFTNRWSPRRYVVELGCSDGGSEPGNGSGGSNGNPTGGSSDDCLTDISGFQFIGSFENSNYFLSNTSATWSNANSTAEGQGGSLVVIDDATENQFLAGKFTEMVYIGLNDASTEGQLSWADGSALGYENFDGNCGFCNDNDTENDFVIIHPWNAEWSFTNQWSQRRFIMEIGCDDDGGTTPVSTSLSYSNCAQNMTIQLQPNQNSAGVNWSTPSLNSNCLTGISSNAKISGPNNGSNLTAGNYTVSYRGTNNCGDIATCSFTIEVLENTGSTNNTLSFGNCPSDRALLIAPGESTAFVNWTPPSVSSSCNAGGLSLGLLSGPNNNSNLPAGAYEINYRAVNNCGDVAMCSFTINVMSSDSPSSLSINCPEDINLEIPVGSTNTTLSFADPIINNVCNSAGTTLTQVAGPPRNSLVAPGSYLIRYRATNNCNDEAFCEFNVVVTQEVDDTSSSLSIECPIDIDIEIPVDLFATPIIFNDPIVNNTCATAGSVLEQISGPTKNSLVFAGDYVIQYRATNNCNDEALCSFNVSVLKNSNNVFSINCPEDVNLTIPAGGTTTTLNFIAPITSAGSCNIPGRSIQQISGPPRGSQVSEGNYVVVYEGTNSCGEVVTCEFNVNVVQDLSSTITVDCPQGDQTFTVNDPPLPAVALWFFEQPTYTNTCPLTLPNNPGDGVRVTGPNPFNQGSNLSVGNRTVTYTASNLCGDTASCSWNITVLPSPIPTIVSIDCPDPISVTTSPGSNSAQVSWTVPIGSSNCPSPSVNVTQIAGPQNNTNLSVGNYTVTYRATTSCNDQAECSFQVNVISGGDNGGGGSPGGTPGSVNYTANDQVTPYTGLFRPGSNVGYNPPWTDEQMADLVAGNPAVGVQGIGAKSMRPGLFESVTAIYGNDFRVNTYDHYESLGLEDLTMIVGFPVDWHRDQTDYCGNGFNSSMFRNLYTDIWDDGTDGTPYNDDNFYAAYLYEIVSLYGSHVKFWEIWNEPGFDLTGNRGWRQPGDPAGNWWDNDPDPCEYILRAPIEHYVRTLRISWEIIKTLQPDDYVTVAGVGFVSFLDAILRNTDNPNGGSVTPEYPLTGGAYFDMMGFHSYPDIDGSVYDFDPVTGQRVFTRNSDVAAQGIKKTQDSYQVILDKHGYDGAQFPKKEWIITEINVPRVPFRPEAMAGGEEMQVNYIIKAVAVAMQNDVTQMHVYNLGDRTTEANAVTEFDLYGLHKRLTDTQAYSQVRNQEAIAYKSAADFVFGSTYDAARTSQMNLPSNADGVALSLPNGGHKYIVWAKTTIDQSEFANASYSFPASFGYNQVFSRNWNFTDTDQVTGISSNNISLTGRPIFITETANPSELAQRLAESHYNLSVAEILPNPAVDEIKLVMESDVSDNYVIQIYNVTGQLIEQRKTYLDRGTTEQRFDISDYSPGMYFVMIEGAVMRSTKVKFVKTEG